MKEIKTDIVTINSGESLLIYLKEKKMCIGNVSGIAGSSNCIFLPDKTSFNWKSRNGEVRVNCKEHAKSIIEAETGLKMLKNGDGDSVRDYSLLINNQYELDKVLEALSLIENNSDLQG